MQEPSCKMPGWALGKVRESAWIWLSCTTAQSVVGTAWVAGKDGSRIPSLELTHVQAVQMSREEKGP